MDLLDFQRVKKQFSEATTDDKIEMYISTEGLTKTQYGELLKLFPLDQLERLEQALV